MRKLFITCIFSIFFTSLFTSQALALQIKSVVDNETVNAKISATEITRIVIQGDRIKSFKGINGAYTRENDKNNGEVYLQPTTLYQKIPFTILVATEFGRHFTLLLTPAGIPGGTLMLMPKGIGSKQAAKFERASNYELTLSHLIRAMATDTIPEGYTLSQIENKKIYAVDNVATLRLKTIYQGLHFQGQIYELTNNKSFPITLNEQQFFNVNTRAVSLENLNVAPHCKIKVLRVVSNA